MCVCVCARARARVCVRACVRACMRACMRVGAYVCVRVRVQGVGVRGVRGEGDHRRGAEGAWSETGEVAGK